MKGYAKAIQELKLALNVWEPAEIDIGGDLPSTLTRLSHMKKKNPWEDRQRLPAREIRNA